VDRSDDDRVPVTVLVDGIERRLSVPRGKNLREALLEADCSPYSRYTAALNCGGRGLCATCGVRLCEGVVEPDHWHDRLAARFGYPRLSCQVTVEGPMTVALVTGKRLWGGRE